MSDPWERLRTATAEALDWLWYGLAKEGRESAVLAPLAKCPVAAAYVAGCLAMSPNYVQRKLAAMLAGWIDDPDQSDLLAPILDNERQVFADDSLTANSVGEDIMFAATRWSHQPDGPLREAGLAVLAGMIDDALEGIPWNTVHWAVANLHAATGGQHPALDRLRAATDDQIGSQDFFGRAVAALRSGDMQTLKRWATPPAPPFELSPDEPNYLLARALWEAAAEAEASFT